jgi:hypothetical protein
VEKIVRTKNIPKGQLDSKIKQWKANPGYVKHEVVDQAVGGPYTLVVTLRR